MGTGVGAGNVALPQTLRGWTFVQDPGLPSEAVIGTQTAVPFERLQVTGLTAPPPLGTVISVFNRFVDRVISATLGSRSVPFGAGGTVLVACSFTSGVPLTVAHRLGTANVSPIGWSRGPASLGVAGFGSFTVSPDGGSVVLNPITTFVADVFITVGL